LPIILTLFAGRIYCGGVCPFGAVQEFMYKAGSKIKFNNSKPGLSRASWPKYIKYLMLLGILLITPLVGSSWWCQIDPFGYLFNFSGTSIALTLLIFLLVLSVFISRPWCRFICPYGAMLGIVSKDVDLLKKTASKAFGRYKDPKAACGKCTNCDSKCPVSASHKGRIDMAECINCGSCKNKCLKYHLIKY
jgi:polyferredoxin